MTFDNAGNTFSGKIVATGTYIGVSAESSLGATPGSFVADSITLAGNATLGNMSGPAFGTHGNLTLSANRGITLGAGGGTIRAGYSDTMTVNGIITGTNLIKTDGATLVLTGANTYSGGTNLNAGTLRVSTSDSALGTGTLNFSGNSTLATASGGGARILTNAITINTGVTANVDGGFADLTLNGNISGLGALTKASIGNVILGGVSAYSGKTTVSAGTLKVASTGALQINTSVATGVSVAASSTLAVDGKLVLTSTTQSLIVNSGTVALNAGSAVLDLNSLFNGATAGQTYNLISGGTTTGNFSSFANYTGGLNTIFNNATGTLTFNAVPEPSTYGLIGSGAVAAVAFVRRRRKSAGIAA